MNVLVLGGTQFVGRHIVEAFVAAGHSVSVLNRGVTPDALPTGVQRIRGDRSREATVLDALVGQAWDACVDVSGYTPRQVRATAELLCTSVSHYVFISAVSVYGDPKITPVSEAHPTLAPAGEDVVEIDSATYGPLKVACENVVRQVYGDRCAILRPQVVAGPYDPLDRFSYWVRRASQPGPMLAPGDGSDHLQWIDASDVARFTVAVTEQRLSGTYNLAGARITWAEFMQALGASSLVWVSATLIRDAGLSEHELPLFRPEGGPRSSLMHVSNQRGIAAGLRLTAVSSTIASTRMWLKQSQLTPALSTEIETRLIQNATRLA